MAIARDYRLRAGGQGHSHSHSHSQQQIVVTVLWDHWRQVCNRHQGRESAVVVCQLPYSSIQLTNLPCKLRVGEDPFQLADQGCAGEALQRALHRQAEQIEGGAAPEKAGHPDIGVKCDPHARACCVGRFDRSSRLRPPTAPRRR